VIPTPRLALALAAAAAVLVAAGPTLGAVAVGLVAAGYLADFRQLRRSPTVARELPGVLERLRPVRLYITSTSPHGGPTRVLQPTIPELRLDAREGVGELATQLRAMRRGRHVLPPVAVRTVGPLGLAVRDREMCGTTEIVVYPDVTGAKRIARGVASGRFSSAGRRRRGPIGIGTEFETIRDYTPDDDIRHVNWRATLRTGRPMTNSFRIDQDRDVMCVIDCGRLMTAPVGVHTRLDVAVDAAAAIAYTADALGDRCGAIAFAGTVQRALPPRRRGARAVVETIHDLEPNPVESNYELAFRTTAQAKRSLVVVFTDLFEEMAAAPLLDALPLLSLTHAVVVAYVRDDDLRTAVIDPGDDRSGPYRSVVALDALRTHRGAVERLRHRGVTVIEGTAESLPEVAVGAYLDLKQRAVV